MNFGVNYASTDTNTHPQKSFRVFTQNYEIGNIFKQANQIHSLQIHL